MKHRYKFFATAASIFLALGVSAEALADPGKHNSAYRSHHKVAHSAKAGKSHYRRVVKKRSAKRIARRAHGHYAPRPYYRYSRHYRHPRYSRYQRYHRESNAGAVVAGLILGGIVYEILKDDHDYEDVYYVRD